MDEHFDVEIHFPYDKVRTERLTKAEVDTIAALVRKGNMFEMALKDFYGNVSKNVEVVNPQMITHMRITVNTPF